MLLEGNIWFLPFEIDFIVWLQSLGAGTFFQKALLILNNFFSFLGEETVLVLIMGAIYWGLDKKKGERIAVALLAANVANPLVKNIVRRLRPYQSTDKIELLRDVGGYSFPSGHSSSSAAFYPGIANQYKDKKRLKVLCLIIPVLVALSRNYLGAHFLTDVVCGLVLGALVLVLTNVVLDRIPNKYYFYIGMIAVFAVGMFYCTTTDYFTSFGMMVGFVAGIFFEERFAKFANTLLWWRVVLRTLVGGGLYLALNSLIKLALGGFFETDSAADLAFRTVRYAVITFALIGVYPMIFKPFDRIWQKTGIIKTE